MQKAGLIEAAVLFLHGQGEVVDGERHSLLLSPSGLVPEGPCCRSARLLQGRQEPASGMDCRAKPGNDSLGMTIGYRAAATRAVRSEERPVGKGMSVRVDLGCRRNHKQKKNYLAHIDCRII